MMNLITSSQYISKGKYHAIDHIAHRVQGEGTHPPKQKHDKEESQEEVSARAASCAGAIQLWQLTTHADPEPIVGAIRYTVHETYDAVAEPLQPWLVILMISDCRMCGLRTHDPVC